MKLADARGLLEFLDKERVAVLAVPVDEAGTLHVATIHYVHQTDPFCFYFLTQGSSEKCRLLSVKDWVKAACAVGTVPDVPFGLQMRGTASVLSVGDNPKVMELYFDKRQSKNRNVEGEDVVIIRFVPEWARYTDYSKGWDTTMLDLS